MPRQVHGGEFAIFIVRTRMYMPSSCFRVICPEKLERLWQADSLSKEAYSVDNKNAKLESINALRMKTLSVLE